MEGSNNMTDDLFKAKPAVILEVDLAKWSIVYDFLSSMMNELFVVFDFKYKKIQYVSNNDLILSGHTQEISEDFSSDFVEKIIHPKDIIFWEDIHHIIVNSLDKGELLTDQVNYFSFLLRMKNPLLLNIKSGYLINYVKLKPVWINEQIRFGICMISASVVRKQNYQLYVYYKNMDYSEYSFKTKKWEYYSFSPLNKRQKEMLIWAQQGLSLKETADKMNVADKTIESIRCTVFEKLGVNTIEQAIQYASNRRLIYHSPSVQSEIAPKVRQRNKSK